MALYTQKRSRWAPTRCGNLERYIMLNIVDSQWKDRLLALGPPQGRDRLAGLC